MSDEQNSAPVVESQDTSSENESQDLSGETFEASQEAEIAEQVAKANPDLSKTQVAAKIRKLKLKVDGREFDEELPFDLPDDPAIREYMTKHLQMSKVSNSRMAEKAQLEKEVLEFLGELKKNPKAALSNPNFGVDLKKLAKDIIEEEIENSKKSPEQLQKEKLESEIKELKAAQEKEKKESRERELQRLQDQEYERYDLSISNALEKSNLPKNPYTVKKLADYMILGLKNNLDVTPEDVLPLVQQEMQEDLKQMFSVMPDELIEGLVGKDVITRIRKKNLSKAKAGPTTLKASIQDTGKTKEESKEPQKKVSFKQFFGV